MKVVGIILLSIVLWWPNNALAQSEFPPLPAPLCGELAEADCQLLIDSQEAMRNLSSMNTAIAVDSGLAGIPAYADEDMAFSLVMDITTHLDPAINEAMRVAMMEMAGYRASSDSAAARQEFTELIAAFYETLGMTMEMQMALPRVVRDAFEADEAVVVPESLAMRTRMVDGYVYIDMDAIAESFPDVRAELEAEGLSGWLGFDMASQLAQDMMGADESSDDSTVQALQMSLLFNQWMADESTRALLDPYITVERLADEERNGETVAVFRTSVDLARLVANRDFTQLLRTTTEMLITASGEPVDEQEMGMGILGIQMLTNLIARSFEFELLQVIGVESAYVYDYNLYIQLDLSGLLSLMAMSGEELPAELMGAAPLFTFDMDASYSDFDAAPEIVAPEDAQIIPLEYMDDDSRELLS
jgi:hypothetical protein